MAQRLGRVPSITGHIPNMDMLINDINARIDEVNRIFYEVELQSARMEGADTRTPTILNDMDMTQHQFLNVRRSREPQNVVTRRELEEIGILGNRADGINLTGDLTVDGSVTITGPSGGGGSEVPTGDDVAGLINTAIEANVATSNDGELWVREGVTGIDGSAGTTVMAIDGKGKTKPLEIRNGELSVRDTDVSALLFILIEEVRKLRNELTN